MAAAARGRFPMRGRNNVAVQWFAILLTCSSTVVAAEMPAAKSAGGEGAKSVVSHVQSEEAQAFRKTAIAVSFPSNGLTLQGWIYQPPGPGPFPAVLWNHGSERNPTAHPELGKFYTSHGFVLFLPIRHGHAPSPGEYIQDLVEQYAAVANDDALVAKKVVELQELYQKDVVAAVQWLQKQPFVDAERIAVSGCSYGGIQTLLAAEKGCGARAFVSFAPGAMSWANAELRQREIEAVRRARLPLFLLQARNDYSIGPSEVLGPILRSKGGLNRATIYPAFGTTAQEGHGGFACWEEGIALWGPDVLAFLNQAGLQKP
jgi:carboxymethylenebutenolidase